MLDKDKLIGSVTKRLEDCGYSSSNQLNHPQLEVEEYDQLAEYSQQNDIVCQNLLFCCLGRLIHSNVSDYIYDGDHATYTYDDLMQSGFLGVGYALEEWIKSKGHFTTYSVYYIEREIRNQIKIVGNMISIRDTHRSILASKLPYLRDQCEVEYGSEVSNEVFAKWVNKNGHCKNVRNGKITDKDVEDLERIRVLTSLDTPIISDEGSITTLLNTLKDETGKSPILELIEEEKFQERKTLTQNLLNALTDKQKIVVELYYGFDESAISLETGSSTFKSVAQVLSSRLQENWTTMQCLLLHDRALKKMKKIISDLNINLDYYYA